MTGVGDFSSACFTESRRPPVDQAIAELAAAQHGVVAVGQLQALGITASAVRHRMAAGKLHRVHRGVYAVGHSVLTPAAYSMAAVLAYGPGTVLSHRSAAALRGLRPNNRPQTEVTIQGRGRRSRPTIQVHGGLTLEPQDITTHNGIPVTTVARTLLDLAEVVNERQVERALDQAHVLRLLDATALDDVLNRAEGRRGAPKLKAVLNNHTPGSTLTRNELEERFLQICRAAGVPRPEVNHELLVDGRHFDPDFAWPEQRYVVETDGFDTHRTRKAMQRDRERDRIIGLAGWVVDRYMWDDVLHQPDDIADTLRERLPAVVPDR